MSDMIEYKPSTTTSKIPKSGQMEEFKHKAMHS